MMDVRWRYGMNLMFPWRKRICLVCVKRQGRTGQDMFVVES